MEPTTAAPAELNAIRIRRAELRDALDDLEHALAAPASGRAVVWGEGVQASAVGLADDFVAHVEATEGPDGLHQAILAGDLRLTNAVNALTAEHVRIADEIAALVADSSAPVGAADVEGIRDRGTALLSHLIRHRQRGADLVYEAYETDIGGGD